jgi:hypothetical protein
MAINVDDKNEPNTINCARFRNGYCSSGGLTSVYTARLTWRQQRRNGGADGYHSHIIDVPF